MKDVKKQKPTTESRRRFLSLLGVASAAGIALPLLPRKQGPKELSLKEADFYRPHDLAG
ncbi:MAG: twin-arginine translocation signal domain-containing protein [Pseudomonadota bacterium]|nr:twin-arginine translocation signal domain-containing protein [Pseudomonadota bacterium]